jgi:Leucine-rich repeat (LRR) protein
MGSIFSCTSVQLSINNPSNYNIDLDQSAGPIPGDEIQLNFEEISDDELEKPQFSKEPDLTKNRQGYEKRDDLRLGLAWERWVKAHVKPQYHKDFSERLQGKDYWEYSDGFRVLNLAGLELDSLSELDIPEVKRLSNLSLRRNALKSIPYNIGELDQLCVLDLSDNQLSSLPDSIRKLGRQSYFILDLSANDFTEFPRCLYCLPSTATVQFFGNPIRREAKQSVRERIGLTGGPKIYLDAQDLGSAIEQTLNGVALVSSKDKKQETKLMLDSFRDLVSDKKGGWANTRHREFFNLLYSIESTCEYLLDIDQTLRRLNALIPELYNDPVLRAACFEKCASITQEYAHSGELMLQAIEDMVLARKVKKGNYDRKELAHTGHRNFRSRLLLARRDLPKFLKSDFRSTRTEDLRSADKSPDFIAYLTQWIPWIIMLTRENPGKFEDYDTSPQIPLLAALTKDYLYQLANSDGRSLKV